MMVFFLLLIKSGVGPAFQIIPNPNLNLDQY